MKEKRALFSCCSSAVGDPPTPTHTPLDISNNSRITRLQQEGQEGLILVFQSAVGDTKHTPLDTSNNSRTRLQQEGKEGVPVSCGRPNKYRSRP